LCTAFHRAQRSDGAVPQVRGLAAQSWLWLTGFSALILLVLWVLQFALFTPFYTALRRREISRTGREIVAAFEAGGDFGAVLRQYSFNQNLRILQIDSSGWILGTFDDAPFAMGGGRVAFSQAEYREILDFFSGSGSRELSYIAKNEAGGSRAVYIARVAPSPSGDRFLYVGSPIPPMDATVSVMATQFLIITALLMLFSAAGSWLLARRISRPILRLTESAKGLAKGEFRAEPGVQDYAEIAQLTQELTRATRELTKAERYRRELLANVSHDLKTPLTIIKVYGEMLRDISGGDPEKRQAHCAKIIEESDRLTDLVNELLEASKLEQIGEIAMATLRIDILLRETAERFSPLQEREGYTFIIEAAQGMEVKGRADLLSRAVYNLIANAVNHAGESRCVWIRLLQTGQEGRPVARVEVSDAGDGIPPEELEHIWERYYKSAQPHKRGVAGSGLGLSIVQAALRLHGARYGAHSVVGQGSTFWFEMTII